MRNFFTIFSLMIFMSFSGLQAQQLSEDFETTTPDSDISLTDWENLANVGGRAWIGKEYDSNKYAQFSSYNSGEANEGWLITPALTLDGTNDFSFDVNIGYWTHDALEVYISTDYSGSPASATWDTLTGNFTIPSQPSGGYGTFATAGTMTLANYSGTAYIAFVYYGDDNAGETTTIQVDNVVVTENSTSIKEQSDDNLSVYPNPASSQINIEHSAAINTISISNINGQKIMEAENLKRAQHSMNVENLPRGVYVVNIIDTNGESSYSKFIKK
ncbi:MAG: choice-of-anchor J domain-containing protein [Bacteroidota bacterium]